MSFRYDVLNLDILDDLKIRFAKPSTTWTEEEYKRVVMMLAAMDIVVKQWHKKSPSGPLLK